MPGDDKTTNTVLDAELVDLHGDVFDANALRIAVGVWNADSKCACLGVMRTGCPCSRCHGHGWYAETVEGTEDSYPGPDYLERYCDCADGAKLRERDGGKP